MSDLDRIRNAGRCFMCEELDEKIDRLNETLRRLDEDEKHDHSFAQQCVDLEAHVDRLEKEKRELIEVLEKQADSCGNSGCGLCTHARRLIAKHRETKGDERE